MSASFALGVAISALLILVGASLFVLCGIHHYWRTTYRTDWVMAWMGRIFAYAVAIPLALSLYAMGR